MEEGDGVEGDKRDTRERESETQKHWRKTKGEGDKYCTGGKGIVSGGG